jgi:hypothetical protein
MWNRVSGLLPEASSQNEAGDNRLSLREYHPLNPAYVHENLDLSVAEEIWHIAAQRPHGRGWRCHLA